MGASSAISLHSFPQGGVAVVIGASGGIGGAFAELADGSGTFTRTVRLSRSAGEPLVDVRREETVEAAAEAAKVAGEVRLVIDATGLLHDDEIAPEKALRQLDMGKMEKSFAVNALGPALLMKHFLPMMPRKGKSVFATLSARVGSIGDNQLGGWYSYRASKAALNMLVRTAAIEIRRTRPEHVCVALHPGSVATKLSAPYGRKDLEPRRPLEAARELLAVLDKATAEDSGLMLDYAGERLPW